MGGPNNEDQAANTPESHDAIEESDAKTSDVQVVDKGVLAQFMDIFDTYKVDKKRLKDESSAAVHEKAQKIVEDMENVEGAIVLVPFGEFCAVKILHGTMKTVSGMTKALAKVDEVKESGVIPEQAAVAV